MQRGHVVLGMGPPVDEGNRKPVNSSSLPSPFLWRELLRQGAPDNVRHGGLLNRGRLSHFVREVFRKPETDELHGHNVEPPLDNVCYTLLYT